MGFRAARIRRIGLEFAVERRTANRRRSGSERVLFGVGYMFSGVGCARIKLDQANDAQGD